MEYILDNHDNVLYLIGGLALVIELTIMGLSGTLLFFALGCICTGVLVSLGVVSTWQYEVLLVGLISTVWAGVLWAPLKKLQGTDKAVDTSSDMIGMKVVVSAVVTNTSGAIRYSGIDWQAKCFNQDESTNIDVGTSVTIKAVEGTVMLVE
ncbi:NfeD family protein [Alteromonas sp. 5E99-2]|uniref:NfeD family protein n=1 Tax=Alteromonas sp. 5E99-2 TaxID=2817683 RepID=UPI001A995B62|nr:NfeD family protein [Alteromonas sp. 5E99-2]MBO1254683.1 NfeD family protein [Alteromonas sp. 5E99-2]